MATEGVSPAHGVSPERLAAIAGCDVLEVLRVLPALELADLVEWTGTGWRLRPTT
jgi:DNA processing protein